MSGRWAPHTSRLMERVSPEWQPIEPLLDELTNLVPPGKALRKYNDILEKSRENNTTNARKAERSDSEKIASGALRMVRDSINSQRSYGRIETKTEDGVEFIRRKLLDLPAGESCPTCGHVNTDPLKPTASTTSSPQPANSLATVTELQSWKHASRPSRVG